jgi:hypothetical protein
MNHGDLKLIPAKGDGIKCIPKDTKVKWPWELDSDPIEYNSGYIVGGPYDWPEEEKQWRLKQGWEVTPYHRVKIIEQGGFQSVLTSYLELDK